MLLKSIIFTSLILISIVNDSQGILAGDEFSLPIDNPNLRRIYGDSFNYVGSLEINTGSQTYYGTSTALSQNWVLSAGHNFDINDDGILDQNLDIKLYLSEFNSYTPESIILHPNFSGFSNPNLEYDLALIRFNQNLPITTFPNLGSNLYENDIVSLIGYGKSGYGNYGYTVPASLNQKRLGYNIIDSLSGINRSVFNYDFDHPLTTGELNGSLGNELESIIAGGDSGGPLLKNNNLVGINTFTSGYGGYFGDTGGGISLNNEWNWIESTTGITIPEPSSIFLVGGAFISLLFYNRNKNNKNIGGR